MASINLLPSDIVRSHEAQRATKILKTLATILGVLSMTLGFAFGAYLFYSEKKITELNSEYSNLKTQVLSLEATENSLILVRDRLTKITEINTKYPYNTNLFVTNALLKNLPEGVTLSQINGNSEKQTFTFRVAGPVPLESILERVKNAQDLKNITVKSLSFLFGGGYELILDVKNTI